MSIARRFFFVGVYMTLALGGFLLTGCSNQSPLAPETPEAVSVDSGAFINVISFASDQDARPRLGKKVKLTTKSASDKFKKGKKQKLSIKMKKHGSKKDIVVHSVDFEVTKGGLEKNTKISMEVYSGATLNDIKVVFGPSGLVFNEEATLTLKLKGPVSAEDINSAIHVHGQANAKKNSSGGYVETIGAGADEEGKYVVVVIKVPGFSEYWLGDY